MDDIEKRLERLESIQRFNTQDSVREFNRRLGHPVRPRMVKLTVTERELCGKLLLEEVIEYLTKGLGLKLSHMCNDGEYIERITIESLAHGDLDLRLDEGVGYDPIESADGLADINVIIHGNAGRHGFNLDRITEEVMRSNFTKFLPDGSAIINGVTPGYEEPTIANAYEAGPGYRPDQPVGKGLKGPNYVPPDLVSVLRYSEEMCPGHVSYTSVETCVRCGTHINSLRPESDEPFANPNGNTDS